MSIGAFVSVQIRIISHISRTMERIAFRFGIQYLYNGAMKIFLCQFACCLRLHTGGLQVYSLAYIARVAFTLSLSFSWGGWGIAYSRPEPIQCI